MNRAIKESPSSETIYNYSSESNSWTESKLNGFQIYFSSKEYWLKFFQSYILWFWKFKFMLSLCIALVKDM